MRKLIIFTAILLFPTIIFAQQDYEKWLKEQQQNKYNCLYYLQ